MTPIISLFVVAATMLAACDRAERADHSDADGVRSAETISHLRVAVEAAVKSRPVRWISPHVLCMPPFDAPDIPSCLSRAVVLHDQATRDALSAMVTRYQGTPPFLACLKVTREITHGDSSFIYAGVAGGGISEGLTTSSGVRTWFRRVNGVDSSWVDTSEDLSGTSAIAPIVNEAACR